ncbi:hypothetical protein FS559_02615 [Treponema phagedenis]|nr:hypothetical protein FS559_02615 [Treponema phagedenis]
MTRTSKLRTGTDARGSNRNDVLKQKYLQSFKTRRLHFDTDGKIRTGTDARGSTQQRCFKVRLFAKL